MANLQKQWLNLHDWSDTEPTIPRKYLSWYKFKKNNNITITIISWKAILCYVNVLGMVGRNKMATISEPTTVVQWQNSWFYSTDSGSIPGGCPRRWKTFCCGHPDAMHQQYGICYSRKELLWILFQIWQHNTHWIKNILRVKKQRVKIIWMFKEHSMNKPCFTQNTWYEWAVWSQSK